MSDKFRLVMNAVDDDLLEEAFAPVKRKNLLPWIRVAIAACLMLVLGLTFAHNRNSVVTFTDLSDMGYVMKLPEDAEQIQYEILTLADSEGAQASFLIRDTEYLYQAVKTPEQQMLSDSVEAEANVLTWNSGNLDMQLLSSSSSTSVSWYIPDDQTQWYLTAKADAQEVLTTASQILRITGLNVTVAPESAGNITYNVFLLGDLTVAETTFVIDGITYAYRMAATTEIGEDFADISGMEGPFGQNTEGEVLWCSAKLSFDEGGQGKIVWFDVVPGILYSLRAESGASADMLQNMAVQLFEPVQDNS